MHIFFCGVEIDNLSSWGIPGLVMTSYVIWLSGFYIQEIMTIALTSK